MVSSTNEESGASNISAKASVNSGAVQGNKRLLSKRELAATLNVSPRTIENWMAQRRIPRLRLSSRLTRFNLQRVEQALARYEVREVGARK